MSDFVNQVGVTLTQQLSASARWLEEALVDLQGFFLSMTTHVSVAWQLFLDDLSVVTNLFVFWINARLDEYPSIKSLNGLSNSDVLIAAISLTLAAALMALSARAKTKRKHVDQQGELTFEEVVLAVSDTERGREPQQFFEIEREPVNTNSTDEKRMTGEKYTHVESTQKQGFHFFKKTNRDGSRSKANGNIEDDVYLLGIEQEMLATRQLYLDGLISKEVYIAETRSLFQKAQTRMT